MSRLVAFNAGMDICTFFTNSHDDAKQAFLQALGWDFEALLKDGENDALRDDGYDRA